MKEIAFSNGAPKPLGPYSQAVISSGMIFCSGQLGIDAGGERRFSDISDETIQCLVNLQNILDAAGSSMDRAIKATIYLTDMSLFQKVNEAYGRFFKKDPPARTTIGVASLPMGARVEIDLIAEMP